MNSELEQALAAHPRVIMTATHVGLTRDESGWEHDAWRVTVYNHTTNSAAVFEYQTGLGRRTISKRYKREGHNYYKGLNYYDTWGHRNLTQDQALRASDPTPPTLADVMSCLLSDAGARETTFEDWCSEFSYSSDSRKALATFLLCQENGKKLLTVLGSELFNELRTKEH